MGSKENSVFERLEQAYERGLRGTVDSLNVWLDNLGIDSKLFSLHTLAKLLLENPESTVDRERELGSAVEFLGFYKNHRNSFFHLPILGVRGIGKSHLMNVLAAFLQRKEKNLLWKFVDAKIFGAVEEEKEETQPFLSFLDELKSKKYEVLLVDSCDKDRNIDESLRQISRHFRKGVLVTAWTPYHWDYFRDRIEETFPTAKEITLHPFGLEETEQFLLILLHLVSRNKFAFGKDFFKTIHDHASGIPTNILTLTIRSLYEAFNSKKSPDKESIKAAARFLSLDQANERISELADHQLVILRHLLLEPDERGTRPSRLVEVFGKDKATISYHLSELTKQHWLTNEKVGRWVFYRIRDELVPLVGLRLMQEADFLG